MQVHTGSLERHSHWIPSQAGCRQAGQGTGHALKTFQDASDNAGGLDTAREALLEVACWWLWHMCYSLAASDAVQG